MKRTFINSMMVALLSISFLAAPILAAADSAKYFYDFQKTYQPWQAGTWKAPVTKQTLQIKYEKTPAMLNGFATLSASPTDAVWMLNAFKATDTQVIVQFDAKRLSSSKHLVPVVYVGNTMPKGIQGFQKVSMGLEQNWQTYTFETMVKGDMVVVAIGFMDLHDDVAPSMAPFLYQVGFDNVTVATYDK